MNDLFISTILECTGATSLIEKEVIQRLWSGYGKIIRIDLIGASIESAIVKFIQLPKQSNHPRGWNTNIGHQRKVKSYNVESRWYLSLSAKSQARLPACYVTIQQEDEMMILLEDLDAAGYLLRKSSVSWDEIVVCLEWLAAFHASYLGVSPDGLWNIGTYWHLDTRPDELLAVSDDSLREAAPLIDAKLNNCVYQTLVHGDAKLANFCFASDGRVAAVDYQYVGGGCGMKDVAYYIGSCMTDSECERLENKILDTYFDALRRELTDPIEELETEWRGLYRVAWADFHRFLKGWSPGHWKLNSYSERITSEVIRNL